MPNEKEDPVARKPEGKADDEAISMVSCHGRIEM